MRQLVKHAQSKLILCFCQLITFFLFSRSPQIEHIEWTYSILILLTLTGLILAAPKIKSKFGEQFDNYIFLISLALVSIVCSVLIFPNYYFGVLAISSPFYVTFFIAQYLIVNNISNQKLILTFLIPIFLFAKHFWSPTTPFSLWVVFTFLQGMNIFKGIFPKRESLETNNLLNFERLFLLFLFVLCIAG